MDSAFESAPLIPKPKVLPNFDSTYLIRDLFQDEFGSPVPSKQISRNLLTSLRYEKPTAEAKETFRSIINSEHWSDKKNKLLTFAENVFDAYAQHEKRLEHIRVAERQICKNHLHYLKREDFISEDIVIQDMLALKRQPLLKSLDKRIVKKYTLLQGEAGLPPVFEARLDFRVQNYKAWKKRLESVSQDSLIMSYINRVPDNLPVLQFTKKRETTKELISLKQIKCRKPRLKKTVAKSEEKEEEIFRAEPKTIIFTDYKPGEIYITEVTVKNVTTKGMKYHLKQTSASGPFSVCLTDHKTTKKVYPGLSFRLRVKFSPKSLDMAAEDVHIALENGKKFLIPLMAYLEPPVLKTHKDIDEFTRVTSEKIASSCIESGSCFTGDSKVTKLRFECFRGSGEFFIMSYENWETNYIKNVTSDNLLELPPFRVYPVFFKIEKDEVIDLYVEFLPKNSGMHVENIMIACDNGEVRSLDLLGDAVGWHSYFFSFPDNLLKQLPVDSDDDPKIKYYIDFDETMPTGKVEKTFSISNNSNMEFYFQWKVRDPNITSNPENYFKIQRTQVYIHPESGTLEANSILEFLVTINFVNAKIGKYRTALSLYVLNLPYQCIEEDDTIIQPTGFVRNLYSQSFYGEKDVTTPSPELLSLQGTYESLQESIKSYVECQTKTQSIAKSDFCKIHCIPNPALCAKPLKKSKTYFNISDNIDDDGFTCACRGKTTERESNSESYTSNIKEEKPIDSTALKSEVIWDFVDILVDEVELWVEVCSPVVILCPPVIEMRTPIYVNEPPVFKEVEIINCSKFHLKCEWLTFCKGPEENQADLADELPFSFLFNKNKRNPKEESVKSMNSALPTADGINYCAENESLDHCKIITEPEGMFGVSGMSEFKCKIGVSISHTGRFSKVVKLSVYDGYEIPLILQGKGIQKYFKATPQILDFGLLRQGDRYARRYKFESQYSKTLCLKVQQFDFDFQNEKFYTNLSDSELQNEFQLNKGSTASRYFYMDCRDPGIKCSLLKIFSVNPEVNEFSHQYIMVFGDVKIPNLALICPRFENAILAPTGTMYVGKQISCDIILKNKGKVETSFTWASSFGCHNTKILVEILPMAGKIKGKENLRLTVVLTPLDEGIINHCYVPCYFSRRSEPLLLSIVGVVEKLNVTFEIIDYPKQAHADVSDFLRRPFYHTVLRVPWPIKSFDPNLGLKFITETDIINMNCHCSDVEIEMSRDYNLQGIGTDMATNPSQLSESTDKDNLERNKLNKDFRVSFEETTKGSKESSASNFANAEKKKYEASILRKYDSKDSFVQSVQFIKSELEFLNVPFQSPVTRQFVIRNETPIHTKFSIKPINYGKRKSDERRIEKIRDTVFGASQGDVTAKYKLGKQALLLFAEPSEGNLYGFEAVLITVTAIGNTWGEYRDYLLCQVQGIETFHLKVFVQLVGHPIFFPMFQNQEQTVPVLRFQSSSFASTPITKNIRVVNRSAIPITVLWIVFLIQPLPREEKEGYNLCADSNANLDSNHSEESSKSVKIYLPKNVSKSSVTFKNLLEVGAESGHNSKGVESVGKSDSFPDKSEIQFFEEGEKVLTSIQGSLQEDELKSESPQFPHRIDLHNFLVEPKEITFEPFEEKRMTITFNPCYTKVNKNNPVEFKAVLAACVKLKPEYEKRTGMCNRLCGMNFVSEVLNLNAVVEISPVTFEILMGDLKFDVNANDVLKAPRKQISIIRKYVIKNNSQKLMQLKIEIAPGVIFHLNKINTLNKIYKNYDPKKHTLTLNPGDFFEMYLECSVNYKDIIYAYEQLKFTKKKHLNTSHSDHMKDSKFAKSMNEVATTNSSAKRSREPWCVFFDNYCAPQKPAKTDEKCIVDAKDSIHLNLLRMSSKSNSFPSDFFRGGNMYPEGEGEYLPDIVYEEDVSYQANLSQNMAILEEEISFLHSDLITQTLSPVLHLHFPAIQISQKSLDFGNVYLNETGVRYCSLINLKGFPTDFKIKSNCKAPEFVVKPSSGVLPATNYSSDVGVTIAVEFTPTSPGYFADTLKVYCNQEMEFDHFEIDVAGIGTWNEKYRQPKMETHIQLPGICRRN